MVNPLDLVVIESGKPVHDSADPLLALTWLLGAKKVANRRLQDAGDFLQGIQARSGLATFDTADHLHRTTDRLRQIDLGEPGPLAMSAHLPAEFLLKPHHQAPIRLPEAQTRRSRRGTVSHSQLLYCRQSYLL